jgi:two-component sensor histidine kinase
LSSYAFDATICVMVIVFINRTLDLLLSSIEREKLAKQHQHLLAGELHHRIQNLFTVIQAVIRFSLPGDAMIEESAIRHRLLDRLQSMSTANRSITDSMGGVQLLDIINNEIRGIESQFEISGAGGLVLGAQITQNFALILHELITNALKYGALSVPGGRVSLRFNRTASGVTLTWQERDGPPVLPPTRTSFGSRILGAFANGFCENVDACYAPSGFRYSLDVRLDELNGSEPTLLAATLASDSIVPAATNESDLCTFLSWLDNERRAVVPDGNRGGKPLSTGSTARPGSTLPSPPNLV